MKEINLAVIGATGMVGGTLLKVLEERKLPIANFYAFASARSAGSVLMFASKQYTVEELNETSFDRGIDIALFCASGDASKRYAPIAAAKGCTVIDNSSAWRMDPEVPLVIPEVNPEDVKWAKGIIANPNCSTIQAVVALAPLHRAYRLKRVVYSTYQSVSGARVAGYNDLAEGIKGNPPKAFPYPIAYNVIPHIDDFTESGYTKEELKMVDETKKILHAYDVGITATTVRVPVFYGHSEAINAEFEKPFDLGELTELLRSAPGVVVQDDPANKVYPMPLMCEGTDDVYVGRIRRDFSIDNGVNLWVVSDNTRKGAATNAVQIAELLL